MTQTATKVIVMSPDELRQLIDEAVTAALARASKPPDPEHLTLAEAAKMLRCSDRTVRRYVLRGRLTAAKIGEGGSRVLVTRDSLLRLMDVSTR